MSPKVVELKVTIPCLISGDISCIEGKHRICSRVYEFYELREEYEADYE